MYRESIGQFIAEDLSKLYVPKNTGLKQYVEETLGAAGVSDNGEFERSDHSIGRLEILSARGEDCWFSKLCREFSLNYVASRAG